MRRLARPDASMECCAVRRSGTDRGISAVLFASFILANLHLAAPRAAGEVVLLSPVKDNTLYEISDGSLSNGEGDYIFAGRTRQIEGLSIRRGLIAFDIAASVPSNSLIQEVHLTLHMSRTPETGAFVSLHRALADWGEGASHALDEEGAGIQAAPGDATWTHRSLPSEPWTAPGGDFEPAASATLLVVGNGFYTWPSTPQMVADVQAWLDDPQSAFGWILLGIESVDSTVKRFDSRDHMNASQRPQLRVVYGPAEVPTLSHWGITILALTLAAVGTVIVKQQAGRVSQ